MAKGGEHIATEVVDNQAAASGIRRVTLARPSGWSFRPGQVAQLTPPPGPSGYFALASSPDEPALSFLIKEGPDTTALAGIGPGERVVIAGPFGAGFDLPAPAPGRRLVFVGAGTALAALRSGLVAASHAHAPGSLALVVGVRRLDELAFVDDIARWRAAGMAVEIVVSRPDPDWGGARGYVQDHVGAFLGADAWVFVAGSDALEDAVEAAALAACVGAAHIQRNYRPDRRARPESSAGEPG